MQENGQPLNARNHDQHSKRHRRIYLREWLMTQAGLKVTDGNREIIKMAVHILANRENLSGQDYVRLFMESQIPQQPFIDLVAPQESWFLRQRDQMDLTASHLVPAFLERKSGVPVRMLSIGCTRGEEPYSLAILLHDVGVPPSLTEIHGIDISLSAIQRGQRGIFSRHILRQAPKEFIARHFTPLSGERFQIQPSYRQQVRLTQMNLLTDNHPNLDGPFDIIFCRNFLQHLVPAVRSRALEIIDGLLASGGALFFDTNTGFLGNPRFQPTKANGAWFFYKPGDHRENVHRIGSQTLSFPGESPNRPAVGSQSARHVAGLALERAESALKENHSDQAITLFDDIIVCHPAHTAQALAGKALALSNSGKTDEALEAAELALEIHVETHALDKGKRSSLKKLIKSLRENRQDGLDLLENGFLPADKKEPGSNGTLVQSEASGMIG